MQKALRETSEISRQLIVSQQFDSIKYAEYPAEHLMKAMEKAYVKVGIPFAKATQASIIKADTFDGDWWTAFFESYAKNSMGPRVNGILNFYEATIWDGVGKILTNGQAQGDSYAEMAKRMLNDLELKTEKLAMSIARTETVAASNYSQLEVVKSMGTPENMVKVWYTIIDDRTHETHIEANGKRVGISEQFSVGGFPCDYPADNVLPAEERYNCRCQLQYEFVTGDAEFEARLQQE
jgi:hypothetical protein